MLSAIKKDGSLRPIACGEAIIIIRRLIGKLLCSHVQTAATSFFVPDWLRTLVLDFCPVVAAGVAALS